jgi:hypothetical protein
MEQAEIIHKFIDDVIDGNSADAKATFDDLVSVKVTSALDQRKQELAQTIFNREEQDDQEDSGDVSSSEEQA